MEKIEMFEVQIDLDGRERLYDYATCREFLRPEGGIWNMDEFKGRGSVGHINAEEDENAVLRVDLLDKAINEKRVMEKKMSKEGPTEDEAAGGMYLGEYGQYDTIFGGGFGDEDKLLPRRVLPVYKGGEVVRGKVVLVMKEPVDAEQVTIHMLGRTLVNVRVYHPRGYYDHQGDEKYIDEKLTVWEKATEKTSSDVSDTFALLSATGGPVRSNVLAAGRHEFAFEFTLPKDAAQSTPPLRPSYQYYCHLVYRIKAKINKGNMWGRGTIATHKGVWVQRTYDLAEDPENLQPASTEESLDTGVVEFWKAGKIMVHASTPTKGHMKGEKVPLLLEIFNESKGNIEGVQARVIMSGKAKTSEGRMALSNNINVKSAKVESKEVIYQGQCPVYKWEIPWDFSEDSVDGALMPVGTLEDSKLMDVKYNICIKLRRSGLHRNMELTIPITVGNVNSADNTLYPSLASGN